MSMNPRAGAPVNAVNVGETAIETAVNLIEEIGGPAIAATTAATIIKDTQPNLGPLANLQGNWTGKGFNILTLPNNFKQNPNAKFRLMVNATMEQTDFVPISAPIPDRGNTQDDIFLSGSYLPAKG